MRNVRQNRTGFTLPEILVSITLLAVLAAVVVPAVASQIEKSDPTRVGGDFLAIRGAIEQFLSDVRKYPKSIGQMTNPLNLSASGMSPIVGTFGKADSVRWKGPYLTKDSTKADSTGYSAAITQPFDSLTLATSGTTRAAGIEYLIIAVGGIDSLSAYKVDQMYDDGNVTTGSFRWQKKGASGTDTLKYLAIPIH